MRTILVHGASHGAWCWYKVVAALRSRGCSVSAVDLAACGSDPRRIPEDVSSFGEYSHPLIELIAATPDGEKLILVGHSFGGLALASAIEAFPHKIAVAVFVAAIFPNTRRPPWHIFEKHQQRSSAFYADLNVKNISIPARPQPFPIITFDSELLARNLYQKCSPEDLALASMLVRPTSFFQEDLEKAAFSDERYGSVDKVFIVCGDDATLPADFQKWMIDNGEVKETMEIEDADHMPMLSKSQELCDCLLKVISKYAE